MSANVMHARCVLIRSNTVYLIDDHFYIYLPVAYTNIFLVSLHPFKNLHCFKINISLEMSVDQDPLFSI